MLDSNAAASASWVSASIATPRGAPVDPEVSFTTATSPTDRRVEARPIADTRKSPADDGQPSSHSRTQDAPSTSTTRWRSSRGAACSSRRAAWPARRIARNPARNAGPLGAARPTRLEASIGAALSRAAAACESASRSPKVARPTGEMTAISVARRSTSSLNASTMQSIRSPPRALPPCEFDTAPIVSMVDSHRDDASSLGP